MHITYDLPISVDSILEAKQRLAGKIYRTGMPRPNYFSERYQGEIFLKFENVQCTGSFKIRGAFNRLCGLTATGKHKGVVAYSTDNHARGVSLSCAMLGIDRRVVMPKGTPKSRVAATYDYSAEVVLYDDNFNDALAKASGIVELEGRIFIPPCDGPQVIAGRDTIGLEILEDLYDVDNVIVPIGGGGLITSITIAIKSINLAIRIIGVQSENIHGVVTSWYTEEITSHRHAGTPASGCDVARPGRLTYEIACQLMDDTVLVSEDDIRQNMVALIQRNKMITKGAGTLACAALLSGKLSSYIQNRKAVNLISGGDIDFSRVSQITDFVDAQPNTQVRTGYECD